MEPFRVHILGCGSALPTLKHNPSCQIVEIRGKYFMLDCGEGTQIQLRRCKINFTKLSAVFITHLHGDHCFGLIGMISTFGLLDRTAPLHVYAPAQFGPMLQSMIDFFCQSLGYEVVFHAVDTTSNKVIYEDRSLTVESLPLRHRLPCCGFLFREKPTLPHIDREMADFHGVPVSQFNNIKNGQDWTDPEGRVWPYTMLTKPADPPRSYAYCSDTSYLPQLHTMIEGIDLLYHEATYASDREKQANTYCHSTAAQAAQVAAEAKVGKLVLGHYSARYDNENVLHDEAKAVFDNTILSNEGMTIDV